MAGAVTAAYSTGQQNGIEVVANGQHIECAHNPGRQSMVDDAPTTCPELTAAYSPGKHTGVEVDHQRPEPRRVRSRRTKKAALPTTPGSLMRPTTEHAPSFTSTVPVACGGALFVLGFLVGWLAGRPGKGPARVDRAIDAPNNNVPVTIDRAVDAASDNGPVTVDCAIDAPDSTGPATVDCAIDAPGTTGPTTVDRAIQCAVVESTATEDSATECAAADEDSAIESTDDVAEAAVEAANIEAADEPPPRPETGVAGPSGRLAAAAEAAGPPLGLVTTVDGGGEASFDDTLQQRDDTGAQYPPHQTDDDGDDELGCEEQRGDGGAQHLPPQVDDDDDGLTGQGEHDAAPSYIRGWRTHPGEPDDGPLSGDYSSVSVIDTLRFRSQRKWTVYSEPPSPAEMIDAKKAARREARQVARKVAPKIIPGLHRRRSSLTYLADRLVAYKLTTAEVIEWVSEDLRAIVEARRVQNTECTRVPTPDAPIPLQTQPNASKEEPNGPVVEAATQPDRRSGSWRASGGGGRQQASQQPRRNTSAADSRTPAPQPNTSREEPDGPVVEAATQPDRRSGSWRASSGGGRQQASQQPRRNTSAADSRTPAPLPNPQDPTSGGQQHGSFVERNGDGHRRRRRHHKRGGNNNGG